MNATLPENTKNSKLILRQEWFTVLLIGEVHQRLVHVGVAHTLSHLIERRILDSPGSRSSTSKESIIKVRDISKV